MVKLSIGAKRAVPERKLTLLSFMNADSDLIKTEIQRLIQNTQGSQKNLLISLITEIHDPILHLLGKRVMNIGCTLTNIVRTECIELKPIQIPGFENWGIVFSSPVGGMEPPLSAIARGGIKKVLESIVIGGFTEEDVGLYAYGLTYGMWTFSAIPFSEVVKVVAIADNLMILSAISRYINRMATLLEKRFPDEADRPNFKVVAYNGNEEQVSAILTTTINSQWVKSRLEIETPRLGKRISLKPIEGEETYSSIEEEEEFEEESGEEGDIIDELLGS